MARRSFIPVLVMVGVFCCLFERPAHARNMVWSGSANGDWFEPTHWTPNGIPGEETDHVTLSAGSILLTNQTLSLASFTMSGGTLVFSNWSARLTADQIAITGGEVTLPPAFTDFQMSNRVWFAGGSFTLTAPGQINADAKGFAGGLLGKGSGLGAGAAADSRHGPGAGHGSFGGAPASGMGGSAYGNVDAPVSPGSGGWGSTSFAAGTGGNGGGVVFIDVADEVVLNGTISVKGGDASNGSTADHSGGGSGGSIWIRAARISGSTGALYADGGNKSNAGGSGAGGRIAINYTAGSQQSQPQRPELTMSVAPGIPHVTYQPDADIGTISLVDAQLLSETIDKINGQLWIGASWEPSALTLANGRIRFPADGFALTVGGDLSITGAASRLELGGSAVWRHVTTVANGAIHDARFFNTNAGPSLSVGGDLTLDHGATLSVYCGPTNAAAPDFGAVVDVTGTLTIGSASWIYPKSEPRNGGAAAFRVGRLNIAAANAGIDADYAGLLGGSFNDFGAPRNGFGIGGGLGGTAAAQNNFGSGGGYGGRGGASANYPGGVAYGSTNTPAECGSGGGGRNIGIGGAGGGLVYVHAERSITHNGVISANGQTAPLLPGGQWGGGGSGGGVYLFGPVQTGTNSAAVIRANGGDAKTGSIWGGGGGGGRIAVWHAASRNTWPGALVETSHVAGGTATAGNGVKGTISYQFIQPRGTLILLR